MTQEPIDLDLSAQAGTTEQKTTHRTPFENDWEALLMFFYVLIPMAIIYYFLKRHNLI